MNTYQTRVSGRRAPIIREMGRHVASCPGSLQPSSEAAALSRSRLAHRCSATLFYGFAMNYQGTDTRLAGDVRVTSTDSIALEFLLPAIERLHAAHPDVRVLLDTSMRMQNLAKREADIAVRSVRPDNPDLVARRLACWPMALFASNGLTSSCAECSIFSADLSAASPAAVNA